jgi:hypothetical protein
VTRVTKLMVWATLAGALVGLVFFWAECWTVHRELSSVIFDAGYEPMPGVEFSTGYTSDSAFSTSLTIDAARPSEWWTWSALVWWAYPLIGAISAAVLAAPCASPAYDWFGNASDRWSTGRSERPLDGELAPSSSSVAGNLLRSRIDLRRPVGRVAGWVDHDLGVDSRRVGETLGSMLTVAAARGDTGTSTWTFAAGIGIVATLASSIYACDLFADVPEPIDRDRQI